MGRVGSTWPAPPGRVVMHVDMDAFFAAVEENLLPILRDKPVVVGGPKNARGVVTTANYAARAYGVGSATPLRRAAKLCPDAEFITSSFGAYGDYSHRMVEILNRFSPKVEPTSVDEAFMDITGMHRHYDSPVDVAVALKATIQKELGLTCSVGIAPNKLLAKMASNQYKPDGLYWVDPSAILEWLAPQPVGNLWGVGQKTEATLERLGIRTIGDLQSLSPDALTRRFGKWGHVMFDLARGADSGSVLAKHERPQEKSVGHEHTFESDVDDPVLWHATLLALSDRVARRLRQGSLRGRTITLKFRSEDFVTRTHAHTLERPTDSERTIFGVACRLLEDLNPHGRRVRLLGVSLSKLSGSGQGEQVGLFESPSATSGQSLTQAVDSIRDKFGSDAIGRLGARYR
jgi:DNA polymerase-4